MSDIAKGYTQKQAAVKQSNKKLKVVKVLARETVRSKMPMISISPDF